MKSTTCEIVGVLVEPNALPIVLSVSLPRFAGRFGTSSGPSLAPALPSLPRNLERTFTVATRNERKRAAKARKLELERAVKEAFALEARRDDEKRERNRLSVLYPVETRNSPKRDLFCRSGKVVKGAFVPCEPQRFEPLRHDDNASGRGQLRKRMI